MRNPTRGSMAPKMSQNCTRLAEKIFQEYIILSRNAITNITSFQYLDFELSFPQARKTGDIAMLSNRRFQIKGPPCKK